MLDPKTVLVLAHDAARGGAQDSLRELIVQLDPKRFRPIVIAPTPGPFLSELSDAGYRVLWGLVQRWVFFSKPFAARSLIKKPWRLLLHPYLLAAISCLTLPARVALIALLARQSRADIIYSNTVTVLDGALAARLAQIPHVWHLRETVEGNTDLRFPFRVAWLPGFVLRTSEVVIVNSTSLREHYFRSRQLDKVRVIPNGIDVERIDQNRALEAPLPVPRAAQLTAICGRLAPRKGIDVYLRSMARLHDGFPDLHHLVIGEGSEHFTTELQNLVSDLGLDGRVWFLGARRDLLSVFSRVNVVVNASRSEPFGRTLIEAMACKVPVVATRSGGPEEILCDGETGFLVDVGDEAAMADRVARLLNDPRLSAHLGAAGLKMVEQKFSLEQTVSSVTACFDKALSADL